MVTLLTAALVALSVIAHHASTITGEQVAITVSFAAVGVLVARRQPGNAIGWLMISPAVCALLGIDVGLYAVLDYRLGYRLPFGPGSSPSLTAHPAGRTTLRPPSCSRSSCSGWRSWPTRC
jgi:hypothetical protein